MKAKALIISYKSPEKLISYIRSLGLEIIFTGKAQVDPRIGDHPDLQLHPLSYRKFIVAPELYEYYEDKLSNYDIKLIKGKTRLGVPYPQDCPYNVARMGKYYICKDGAIDIRLDEELKNLSLRPIYQRQAYASCMTLAFDNFAITCDRSIHKALVDRGIESYYISPKGIKLDGFNIGFLGGACGIIDNKKVLFTGDLRQLKDFNILKTILDKKDIELIYPEGDLIDLGSIIPIY